MSLLEDVFLQDEADEAQELERVIEADEYDERPRTPDSNQNSEEENEAEEDRRRVDPTTAKPKHVVKNPRFILNPARLTGPRGIQVIPEHFKDFKFKGKGHEKEDLDLVLKKLEHWAYRLYPKFQFEDCLKKIETLGKKRPVMVHLHKIRSDQFTSEETVVQRDSSDEEETPAPQPEEDEFDKLLQQQIELARATPAPNSVKKPAFSTPNPENRSITMPKIVSSPSISDEMRERILRNKRLATERRLARLKQNTTVTNDSDTNILSNNDTISAIETNSELISVDAVVVKKSITVDVHDTRTEDDESVAENSKAQQSIINSNDKNEIVNINSETNDPLNELQTDNNSDIDMIEQEPISINDITNDISNKNDCIKDNVSTEKEKDVDMVELIDVSNNKENNTHSSKMDAKESNNINVKDSTEENNKTHSSITIVFESQFVNKANSIDNNSNKENIDNMCDEMNDYEIDEIMEQVRRLEETQDN